MKKILLSIACTIVTPYFSSAVNAHSSDQLEDIAIIQQRNFETAWQIYERTQVMFGEMMAIMHDVQGANVHALSPYVKSHQTELKNCFHQLNSILNRSTGFPSELNIQLISLGVSPNHANIFVGHLSDGVDGETGWKSREIFSMAWAFHDLDPVEFALSIDENYDTQGGCIPGIINRLFVRLTAELSIAAEHIIES